MRPATSRPDLRLVHRGLRHARPQRSEGAARSARGRRLDIAARLPLWLRAQFSNPTRPQPVFLVRLTYSPVQPRTPRARLDTTGTRSPLPSANSQNQLRFARWAPKFSGVLAAGRIFLVPRAAWDAAVTARPIPPETTRDEGRFSRTSPIRAQVRSPLRRGPARAPQASRSGPVSSSTIFQGSPRISPDRPLSDPKRKFALLSLGAGPDSCGAAKCILFDHLVGGRAVTSTTHLLLDF